MHSYINFKILSLKLKKLGYTTVTFFRYIFFNRFSNKRKLLFFCACFSFSYSLIFLMDSKSKFPIKHQILVTEVNRSCHMESHVGQDNNILKQREESINWKLNKC